MSSLEVIEGLREQGQDEWVPYKVNTTPWGGSPSSPSIKAYDEADWSDVTTTVFPTNEPTTSSDDVVLSLFGDLTLNHTYRVEVQCTIGTATLEGHFRVVCVR